MAKKSKDVVKAPKRVFSASRQPAGKHVRTGVPNSVAHAKGKHGNSGDASLFESRWTKPKFEIVGRKRKSEGRRVGLSRSIAIDKRKKTILEEFKSRGKSNVFLDHRFGEKDEALAEEDKAILRFQRERQVQWQKRSKFTLPDEDEETVLTHGGTALSNLDDFEDNLSEEEDDENLDKEIVRDYHFGGGATNGNARAADALDDKRPKSKKEVMEEIVAKSKFYRAQKAKDREEDEELKQQLDKEFSTLAQSQALTSLVRPKKSLFTRAKDLAMDIEGNQDKPDDFDKLVKEMGMEMRARASDRLKTDEELAEEEKARLEELEEKRKRRMLGEELDEDSESEGAEEGETRKAKRRRAEVSGDDLGENFLMDEDEQPKTGWVDDVLARTGEEEEGSSSDEDNEKSSMDEEGADVEEDDGDSSASGTGESEGASEDDAWEKSDDDDALRVANDKTSNTEVLGDLADVPTSASRDLPFVIDAPQRLDEFKSLVDGRPLADLLVVIQRIRTCNSLRLAAENRKKMQVFYGVLLQYFAFVAGGKAPTLDRLNTLVKPLIEMSLETPYFAAVCARERIVRMRMQLTEKLKNPGLEGPWPSRRSLVLFRLWCMTFPPSDFRHVVLTPCGLLMAEYLMRCPVKFARELAMGTFICALLLNMMRPAKRLCPEALSFLYAALVSALPKKVRSSATASLRGCGSFMLELVASEPWLHPRSSCSTSSHIEDLDFDHVTTADNNASLFDSDGFRLSTLSSVLATLEGFSHTYKDLSSYAELFSPYVPVLQVISADSRFPQAVHLSIEQLLVHILENIAKSEEVRQPLRMRVKKPVPKKQFNPKFEENFVPGRNYDPDKERAEGKKLQRLLKQEAKGAARELRKDNYFLQAEKAKEKALAEEQREEKYRKAMAFLQEQEGAFKSGQLGKGRGSRKKR